MQNDCKHCIHLNVCAYVVPDIPTCDSFLSKDILDKIIADTLRKLQSSDAPDKSKAILMELYAQLKKAETSTPPNDVKIVDEWNQYKHRRKWIKSKKTCRSHFMMKKRESRQCL